MLNAAGWVSTADVVALMARRRKKGGGANPWNFYQYSLDPNVYLDERAYKYVPEQWPSLYPSPWKGSYRWKWYTTKCKHCGLSRYIKPVLTRATMRYVSPRVRQVRLWAVPKVFWERIWNDLPSLPKAPALRCKCPRRFDRVGP